MPRRRLRPEERRAELIDAGEQLFARRGYDDVAMEEVARYAEVSRALLYQYFATKRDLFAAVYQRAADRLLDQVHLTSDRPLPEQIEAGLDAHFDYFEANRATVIAANRTLAGDPAIQAIISDELSVLRERVLEATNLAGERRALTSSILQSWLVFVRLLTVDWLIAPHCSRAELRRICTSTLLAALA
ncbi:TetR/AcrR family transcriptional regulator [Kribbella sp. NPDC054772]